MIAEDIAATVRGAGMTVVAMCDTGEEAIAIAKRERPDIIIMDIQLAGAMDGVSSAQMILQSQGCSIIYLTEYTNPAVVERAKTTYPANFLTKPFRPEELVRAIDIAVNNANHDRRESEKTKAVDSLFVRTANQKYVKVPTHSIVYLKADRAYCVIVTDQEEFVLSNSLSHYHGQLDGRFVRVHRSFVVNIQRITALDGNMIKLGNFEVTMTKEYRDDLVRLVNILK